MINMNWKQFLKPDRRKKMIFAFMLLLYLSAFFTFNSSFCGPPSISEQKCSNYYTKYWIDSCSMYCGEPDLLTSVINIVYFLLWLVGIFIIYPLSCLIVWIYDKFRKRKKY
jgi:hypothetical protein